LLFACWKTYIVSTWFSDKSRFVLRLVVGSDRVLRTGQGLTQIRGRAPGGAAPGLPRCRAATSFPTLGQMLFRGTGRIPNHAAVLQGRPNGHSSTADGDRRALRGRPGRIDAGARQNPAEASWIGAHGSVADGFFFFFYRRTAIMMNFLSAFAMFLRPAPGDDGFFAAGGETEIRFALIANHHYLAQLGPRDSFKIAGFSHARTRILRGRDAGGAASPRKKKKKDRTGW